MNNINILHMLVGEWTGTGQGEFPTIAPFEYLETLRVSADDRPFLHFEQKTRRRNSAQADYVPSHWESGFIRLLQDGQVEMINAQGSGRLERLAGSIEQTEAGLILRLQSTHWVNDPRMLESSRTISVEGDTLYYTQNMRTTAISQSTLHVKATLKRIA